MRSDGVIWQLLILLVVAAVVTEGIVLVGLMREVGTLLLRDRPASPGRMDGGPELGTPMSLPNLAPGEPAILLFLSPGCGHCEELLANLPALERDYPAIRLIGVPVSADDEERKEYAARLGPIAREDLYPSAETWGIQVTPFAVGVDAAGHVAGTGVVNHLEHLKTLALSVSGRPGEQDLVEGDPGVERDGRSTGLVEQSSPRRMGAGEVLSDA